MRSFLPKNLALFSTILLFKSIEVYSQTVNIGDEVCVAGYIMDTFCIDRGTLLDRPSLTTLGPEGPPGHSVHCLVDIGICNSSPFEVLEELDDGSYGRAWRVEDNELLLSHARSLGSCSTCEDSGSLVRGYQATVLGIVQELASGDIPPVISVNEVADVEDFERLCNESEDTNVSDEEESANTSKVEDNKITNDAEEVVEDAVENESPSTVDSSSSILKKKLFWSSLIVSVLSLSSNSVFY